MKSNKDKIILDLCGGTGAWSKPYKDAGYDVRVITLPQFDVTRTVCTPDLVWFYPPEKSACADMCVEIKEIYGVLCAPPCTEFSRAKSTAPRDFYKGMETVEACLKIIWAIQKRHKLQFWALENPMGLLRRFLGNPYYNFRQWWFGNNRQKETDLWGRFEIPKRTVFKEPADIAKAAHNRNADWFSNTTAKRRAITPEGFAKAFYKANK